MKTEKLSNEEGRSFSFASCRLTDKDFARLSAFIEDRLGIRMPQTKRIMLESRLQKRLRALGIPDFTAYIDYVFSEEGERVELHHMFDVVTTNKTDFFREPDHFAYLLETLLPARTGIERWGIDRPLQLWSAGCSSGEEPYTIAMVLRRFQEQTPRFDFRITGSDISTQVLERATIGVYSEERIDPVPFEYRKKYILRSKDRDSRLVRIVPELRNRIEFRRLNLMDPSYGLEQQFEIIFCRNVIIYFDRSVQERILARLYRNLKPGGYLFLGHSETLCGMSLPLRSVAPTIYRKEG